MTVAVQELLNSFESLSEAEKHQASVEILRRSQVQTAADLPEDAMVGLADDLFLALDNEEANDADS